MPYLAVDQYGNKTIIKDKKIKTLKDVFYCSKYCRINKMYRDFKDQNKNPVHVGYVLGQGHNNMPLWVELFKLMPLYEDQ